MFNTFFATLHRDLSVLSSRRGFWWLLALWSFIAAVIFFAYLEDFLAIQPQLRAKNFRYGVTDLVIIPYLKTLGILSMVFMASLCSRLFYHERFSPFSALYRSSGQSLMALMAAKWGYIMVLSLLAVMVLALPAVGSGFFFTYNGFRVAMMLVALFVLLLSVGVLAMVLSQVVSHSILVVLLIAVWIAVSEIAVRLLVEPTWIVPIVAFFSPLAHLNRIATGVVTVSDGVFFVLLVVLLTAVSVRQYNNSFLFSH